MSSARNTPSPIDPESIEVATGYEPDPADLALSSVPGQEMFDPRKRKFSAEELKPQPMIKKARKIFLPNDMKVIWNWLNKVRCVCLRVCMCMYMCVRSRFVFFFTVFFKCVYFYGSNS